MINVQVDAQAATATVTNGATRRYAARRTDGRHANMAARSSTEIDVPNDCQPMPLVGDLAAADRANYAPPPLHA
jgi:hypothetical protein